MVFSVRGVRSRGEGGESFLPLRRHVEGLGARYARNFEDMITRLHFTLGLRVGVIFTLCLGALGLFAQDHSLLACPLGVQKVFHQPKHIVLASMNIGNAMVHEA